MKIGTNMLTIAIIAALSVAAWAAGGEVMKNLKAEGWTFTVHVRSIPEEYREMAKATHHLSVTLTNPEGEVVSDAAVSYEFIRKEKVVASGSLAFMGGAPGHGHHGGHYGADITLPETGEHKLVITLKKDKTTVKVSGEIEIP